MSDTWEISEARSDDAYGRSVIFSEWGITVIQVPTAQSQAGMVSIPWRKALTLSTEIQRRYQEEEETEHVKA